MLNLDFTQINFVRTCQTDIYNNYVPVNATSSNFSALGVLQSFTDNTSYVLQSSTQQVQCYNPMDTFWSLTVLLVIGCYLTYKIICLIV